jgi:hypothetical protein
MALGEMTTSPGRVGEGSAYEASTPLKMCMIYERKLGSAQL